MQIFPPLEYFLKTKKIKTRAAIVAQFNERRLTVCCALKHTHQLQVTRQWRRFLSSCLVAQSIKLWRAKWPALLRFPRRSKGFWPLPLC